MRTIRLKKILTDEQTNSLLGAMLLDDSYDMVVSEDCDAIDDDSGEVLFKFRKAVIPKAVAAAAYKNVRTAAKPSQNRSTAAVSETSSKSKFALKSDGTKSNTHTSANPVNSGIIGHFDRYPRNPYCRTTAWTQTNMDKFKKILPIIRLVDEKYKELMPDHYAKQRAIADKTSPDFVIKDTAFTTVTVNKNYQTAVHCDAGDFSGGFGNLVVLRAGRYTGGYFVLPQYRVAIDLNNLDLLLVDVHKPHGNTPIVPIDRNAERISLVMYYRERMIYCGSKEDELEFAKSRTEGEELLTVNLNKYAKD